MPYTYVNHLICMNGVCEIVSATLNLIEVDWLDFLSTRIHLM